MTVEAIKQFGFTAAAVLSARIGAIAIADAAGVDTQGDGFRLLLDPALIIAVVGVMTLMRGQRARSK